MGYIASSTTTTVTARLTPYGRKKLLSTSNTDFVLYFALGDSDANYQTTEILQAGEVPGNGGDLNSISGVTTSIYGNVTLRNKLIYNNIGDLYKSVGTGSFIVNETNSFLGNKSLYGNTITHNKVSRGQISESLVNILNSFGLPLTDGDVTKYNSTLYVNGGYNDTAIASLGNQNVLILSIPNSEYGEIIDGKTIRLQLSSNATTYIAYSTFQRATLANSAQDVNIRETSLETVPLIGDNIAFLFSDNIKKPNGDSSKSWSTGNNLPKPFTYGKEYFNFITNSNLGYTADTAIGITYLDKGFIVITDSTIVNNFIEGIDSTATTLTYNSVVTDISQAIVCDSLNSEFRNSTNPTFVYGIDTPRVTEIGLYDKDYKLVAIAKLNKPYELTSNYFRVEVKISV